MPLFQTVMTAKAATSPSTLAHMVKSIAKQVIGSGGVVRSVENIGVRKLPYRFKSKFADRNGMRYHYDGRFIALRFDASPGSISEVERIIKMEEDILRFTTTRPVEIEASSKVNKWKKNPWLDLKARNLQQLADSQP